MTRARRGLALAAAAVLLSGVVGAQTLSPAPLPGLWETEMTRRINGQDPARLIRQAQDAVLALLPPAQRAQAEAAMRRQIAALIGGTGQTCLTAAGAAAATDPQKALAMVRQHAPACRLEPAGTTASSLAFKGRCDDPNGFTGDVAGELTLVDPKQMTWSFLGNGRMPAAAAIPGLDVPANGAIELSVRGRSRWLSASDCADTKR